MQPPPSTAASASKFVAHVSMHPLTGGAPPKVNDSATQSPASSSAPGPDDINTAPSAPIKENVLPFQPSPYESQPEKIQSPSAKQIVSSPAIPVTPPVPEPSSIDHDISFSYEPPPAVHVYSVSLSPHPSAATSSPPPHTQHIAIESKASVS